MVRVVERKRLIAVKESLPRPKVLSTRSRASSFEPGATVMAASRGARVTRGLAGVGAIHIPGTPNGYDASSVMLACFDANETGEFGPNDVTALQNMYYVAPPPPANQ